MAGALEITWEPLDAPGVDDKAEAATWARMEIWVHADGDRRIPVTTVWDPNARVVRDGVYGTVLPLAEWIVRSWSHLFRSLRAEPEKDAPAAEKYRWDRVHRWRYAGEGTALPDLTIAAVDRERARIRWCDDINTSAAMYERVLFQSHGEEIARMDSLRESLQAFVHSVIERLMAVAPRERRTGDLVNDWKMVRGSGDPSGEMERLSARLGLLWWDLTDAERGSIGRLARHGHNAVEMALLEAADFERLDEWIEAARRAWEVCESSDSAPTAWREIREKLKDSSSSRALAVSASGSVPDDETSGTSARTKSDLERYDLPWARGWSAAKLYRRVLGMSDTDVPPEDDLGVGFSPVQTSFGAGDEQAAVAWRAGHMPVRIMERLHRWTRMHEAFTRARDLYPILFESGPDSDFAVVFSMRLAGANSVANAFAAELLAPVALVEKHVGSAREVDANIIGDIANEMGAPFNCVQHQMENHNLVRVRYLTD